MKTIIALTLMFAIGLTIVLTTEVIPLGLLGLSMCGASLRFLIFNLEE